VTELRALVAALGERVAALEAAQTTAQAAAVEAAQSSAQSVAGTAADDAADEHAGEAADEDFSVTFGYEEPAAAQKVEPTLKLEMELEPKVEPESVPECTAKCPVEEEWISVAARKRVPPTVAAAAAGVAGSSVSKRRLGPKGALPARRVVPGAVFRAQVVSTLRCGGSFLRFGDDAGAWPKDGFATGTRLDVGAWHVVRVVAVRGGGKVNLDIVE